LTWITKRVAI